MRLFVSTTALLLLLGGCASDPSPSAPQGEAAQPASSPTSTEERLLAEKEEASAEAQQPSVGSDAGEWELYSIGEGIVARDGMAGLEDRESEGLVIVYTNNVDGEIEPCG